MNLNLPEHIVFLVDLSTEVRRAFSGDKCVACVREQRGVLLSPLISLLLT
jgi:hypothetical protein